MLIIVFGVFLEISFAILSVIAETSTLLMTAEGTLVILYSVGILEIVSLLVILQLFSSMSSKELENLRWISKVGTSKNKINQEYEFQMPVDLKASDKTKTMFEERINQC